MSAPVTPLRLLLVEDSESDAGLVLREFHRAGLAVEHQRVQSAEKLAAALAAHQWDVVICDFSMPGFGADAALVQLRRSGHDLPFLLVSGTIPDEDAVQLMRDGAHDYILKDNLARLVPAAQREIKEAEARRHRRHTEQALRDSEERLRMAQGVAGIGAFDVDLIRDYATWTEQEEAIFGFAPGTFDHTSKAFWDLIHPEDRELARQAAAEAMLNHAEFNLEYRFYRHSDQALRWASVRGKALYDPAGQPIRMLGVNMDITERRLAEDGRKSLEAQLRQVQKLEAIGQLSGGVAHDFNNILTVIQGHVALLETEPALSLDAAESISEIRQAAERAANLTRQLLAFSRRQTLQPANLDLNDAVVNLTKMLQRIVGEDISMQLHFSPEPVLVRADASMLGQILLNLVVNARDAMPEGGKLVLETGVRELDDSIVAQMPQARPGTFACLSVSDTGCGIPPEILPHIFEPFFTTKDVGKGTGLGLATVYGIVQQHQGWVTVYSELGQGTVFRIYLPRLTEDVAARAVGANLAPVRGGNETILVVEDEPSLRHLVRGILTRLGYQILEAHSGVMALKVWQEHRHQIQLVLTDMVMPDRMSGLELARRLHAENPALRVVYTSGYSPEIAGRDFPLQEGVNFIAKPFNPRKLAELVRASLDA